MVDKFGGNNVWQKQMDEDFGKKGLVNRKSLTIFIKYNSTQLIVGISNDAVPWLNEAKVKSFVVQ